MLHYRRHGHGRTLVLLHGFVGSAGYWLPQETSFKSAFDVITIDLPAFAKSADVPAPDTIEGYGAAVFDLLDELGVDRFSLIGFSMGGMIAQQMALDRPARIDRLILYGTAAVGEMPSRFESWTQSIERLRDQGVVATTDNTVATWFVDGVKSPLHEVCRRACEGANLEGCITVMTAMQSWSAEKRLGEISMPTLVIVGDMDRSATPRDALTLWDGIANACLSILPGCAHGAHLEKPDLFNRIVLDFLSEETAAP